MAYTSLIRSAEQPLRSGVCRLASILATSIKYKTHGDPGTVLNKEQVELSTDLDSDKVLVEMLAAPINPADINTVQGVYALKPPLPAVGGFEGVGKVLKVNSSGKDLEPGDWVIHIGFDDNGTWTSHAVWPVSQVMKVPNDISLISAATLSVNPCTAYRMLHDYVNLKPGDVVVQNGGNSAVGQAVIQIAHHMGVKTINVVRSRPQIDDLKSLLTEMGADHVVTEEEVRNQEFGKVLKEIGNPKLALNCVGGKSATELTRLLAPKGVMVTYGGMSKQPVIVSTAGFIFNDITLRGFWMTQWKNDNPDSPKWKSMVDDLCELIRKKVLLPPVCDEISLDDFKAGIQKSTSGFTGKKQIFVMKTE